MAHSHSACPICSTTIENRSKEDCDKCGWILKTEDLLSPKIHNSLLDWGIRYYQRVEELENRGKYRQDLLNNRLDRHNDEIDLLKKQMKDISSHFPEIIFTFPLKEINNTLEKNISVNPTVPHYDLNPPGLEESKFISIDRQESILSHQEKDTLINSELPKSQQDIISFYNHDPREFVIKYQVKVANITKDCINANRGSEEKNVILEENNRGNYWIFDFGGNTYLVPVKDKYINQHSYTTTTAIFAGHNYTPDYQKIQLFKPAIVLMNPNTSPQTWRLQQQGELAFL
jgi:hypothetical protein